jgi:AraC-like DNA-binding protein
VSFAQLRERLERLERFGGTRWAPDAFYHAGAETRTTGESYYWDGLKRGAPGGQTFAVFQVTLDGRGIYEDERGPVEQTAGGAFLALIPGAHRYYLPDGPGGSWSFFWAVIRHPYIVERLARQHQVAGATRTLSAESLLLLRAAALCEGGFRDHFEEEGALFAFLLEYERHQWLAGRGQTRLEDEVRTYVLENLHRPVDVSELARHFSMSRSRFSHHFRDLTGATPARFLLDLRLDIAARHLTHTDETLAHIARQTGFADANHLCKAFRRRFHVSPGAFRRQLR